MWANHSSPFAQPVDTSAADVVIFHKVYGTNQWLRYMFSSILALLLSNAIHAIADTSVDDAVIYHKPDVTVNQF